MSDPKKPVPGDKHIDASALDLVDLTSDEMNKFIKPRDGIGMAIANLRRLDAAQIERAGLNANDVKRAIDIGDQFEATTDMIPATEKLAEMLIETRALRGNEIAKLLGEIAAQARRRGEREPDGGEILGPLADLFAYQYGPAKKAAAKRAKASKANKNNKKQETPAKEEGEEKNG